MCNFETLYSSSFGFIVRCHHCKYIQIGFGTVCITFRESDFMPFVEWLSEVFDNTPVTELSYIKNIRLPTPCEGFQLILSYEELKELFCILDLVDTELKVQSLTRQTGVKTL